MTKGIGRAAVVGIAALAIAAGAAGAIAAPAKGGPLKAAAAYIGVTVAELREQLRSGRSLAQVATAEGKSVDGLKAAILANAKERLDRRVASGKLTEERAAQVLDRLESNLDRIVNRPGLPARARAATRAKITIVLRGAVRITAQYTGLTLPQVREQLRGGKSLAQIAEGSGKSVEGLKQVILERVKARIDRLVAAGKLSAARGERYYDALVARIDKLLNRTPGARG